MGEDHRSEHLTTAYQAPRPLADGPLIVDSRIRENCAL